jgi:hypothetical protein
MNITDQQSFDLNRHQREELIAGYSAMIEESMSGRVAHYINFMFNSIHGSRETKIEIMTRELARVYDLLTRHIVRKPTSSNWEASRPIFIGCPDLPVVKRQKQHVRNFMVNDGLHFNVISLTPAIHGHAQPLTHLFVPRSRMTENLVEHFRRKHRQYQTEQLYRIDVTPITYGTMADYTLKAFKNGHLSSNDILVLK